MTERQSRRNLRILVTQKNSPIRCGRKEFQNLFWLRAKKATTRFKLKFNLFGDQFRSAVISEIAAGRNVSEFHRGPLLVTWRRAKVWHGRSG